MRELGRAPEVVGAAERAALENRWREGFDLDELEDAAYAAGTEDVQRNARAPFAFVFARNCIERRAHAGRPRRAKFEAEARAAAAAAKREAAPAATLEDLSRAVVADEQLEPGEIAQVVVKPIAVAIAEHRAAPAPLGAQLARLDALGEGEVAEATQRANALGAAFEAAWGTPGMSAAREAWQAALAEVQRLQRGRKS